MILRTKRNPTQGSVMGSVLYLLYVKDAPKSSNCINATFSDDTATWRLETQLRNQKENCNEQLIISSIGHLSGTSSSMNNSLRTSISQIARLIIIQSILLV